MGGQVRLSAGELVQVPFFTVSSLGVLGFGRHQTNSSVDVWLRAAALMAPLGIAAHQSFRFPPSLMMSTVCTIVIGPSISTGACDC